MGTASEIIRRWRPEREIDPIEANALHGGRMSLLGSIIVAAQTVWSSGVGASVGLEAGYTQFASGIASRIGNAFRLRRGDLRILVGCGAAGGIAGAFGAPLAGAFYAFELIIGSYSPNSLAPVGIASLMGYLVARQLEPAELGVVGPGEDDHHGARSRARRDARAVGRRARQYSDARRGAERKHVRADAAASVAAHHDRRLSRRADGDDIAADHVVGARRVARRRHARSVAADGRRRVRAQDPGVDRLARLRLSRRPVLLFAADRRARRPSLGRDLTMIWPTVYFDPNAYSVIGMSALSASVIGGPLTMTFIALETTGDLWLTTAVLIAVIIAAQVTREVFGYSFATWRFHLRGETIRSAADIGWMRELTVEKMMRQDVQTVNAASTVAAFREQFPLSSTAYVVAVDEADRYIGLVLVADAHAAESADKAIKELLQHPDDMLLPGMAVKEAVLAFDRAESEALAVVDSYLDRRVVGMLTEAYVLRRYSAALEGRRRDLVGEE